MYVKEKKPRGKIKVHFCVQNIFFSKFYVKKYIKTNAQ